MPCRWIVSSALLTCAAWGWAVARPACAQPSVTHASPAAISPASSTRIIVSGDKLSAPLRVWTSAPVDIAVVAVEPKQATLDITPQQELPLGPFGLWLATDDGLSGPLSLLVDELPSIEERSDNHAPITAQSLGMSAAIDAVGDGKLSDYFRFHADKGQEITFEILAEHIGSAFDPVVRLLDDDARELAAVDDEAISPDCRFRHCFERSGNYLLEIHDNRYAAGGHYRLRIGTFPLVAFAYPPVVQRGTCTQLQFAGTDRARMAERSLQVPTDPSLEQMVVTAPLASGGSATWASVRLDDNQQLSETEPNDAREQANAIEAAHGLNGMLERPGDRDVFRLHAKKDETRRIAATGRSFGSSALPKMKLTNAVGDVVGKSAVGDSDEWQFDVKFPADGEYYLEVEDLLRRGGSEYGYHISIGSVPPFTLSLKADAKTRDRFALEPTRGAAGLDVVVQREGYKGPIELSLQPPTAGLTILNPIIPADAKEARIIILAQPEWTPESVAPVRLIGRPVEPPASDPDYRSTTTSTALLVLRAPHVPYPSAWQDGLIAAVGIPDRGPLLELNPVETPVAIPRSLADASLTLVMKRLEKDFKGSPTLIESKLPDGWSAANKADKDNIVITLKHPLGISEEDVELSFRWYAELNGRGQVINSKLSAKLFDPLKISAASPVRIKPGESLPVVVEVVRSGGEPQPVVVKCQNLPAGVTAPDSITIPAEESKAQFELVANADAAAAKVDNLVISGQTKFAGQELIVQSALLQLEVTP